MSPFTFNPAPSLVFGPGSIARLGEIAAQRLGPRVLVVTDAGLVKAGLIAPAHHVLEEAGVAVDVFDAVVADQCSSVMLICPDAGSIFHEPVPPRHTVVTPLNSIQVLSAVCVSCIDGMARDGFGEFHGEL